MLQGWNEGVAFDPRSLSNVHTCQALPFAALLPSGPDYSPLIMAYSQRPRAALAEELSRHIHGSRALHQKPFLCPNLR